MTTTLTKLALRAAAANDASNPAVRAATERLVAAGQWYRYQSADPVLSPNNLTGMNAMEAKFIPPGAADLRIELSNENGTGPITVKTTAQFPAETGPAVVKWNGSDTVTIPKGKKAWSDPYGGGLYQKGAIPPGTQLFLRHYLTCDLGTQFELVHSSGLGMVTGTTQTDQTENYGFGYGPAGVAQFGATALLGLPLKKTRVLAAIGDSITRGQGGSVFDRGPLYYIAGGLAADAYPWGNCAVVGDTAAWFAGSTASRRQSMLQYADDIFAAFGTNDVLFSGGAIALDKLQDTLASAWWGCGGFGACVYGCTIPPNAASANGWIDLAGQTPEPGWEPGGVVQRLNAWMRAGAPRLGGVAVAIGTPGAIIAGMDGHPLYAVCDWAAAVEAPGNPGKWIVNGTVNYATADKLHPTDAAAQFMAATARKVANL